MYKKSIFLSILMVTLVFASNAQYRIEGQVTGNNLPLEGVSISVKGSYNGGTSDKNGNFSFQISDTGYSVIQFSLMGFKPYEKQVRVSQPVTSLAIMLKEEITEMKAVVITAGTFEASDKKRSTVLKSVDVVTSAGQQADVVSALKTLPGAQQIGEQEGLFVRGGTGQETKVFIDGMMVTNPFFSSVPGIAQRSRFSPLLFKGTVFSSGGYSAQYGQGLSSALILESIDLPSRSEVNMIISSPQVSFMGQKLNKSAKSSVGLNVNYMNLAPYFSVIPQKYHYTRAPEAINTEFNFRKKVNGGIIKFYGYASTNEVGFDRPSLDHINHNESFVIRNRNIFTNATYNSKLQNDWSLFAGTSFSYNKDKIKITAGDRNTVLFSFLPELTNRTFQSKVVLTKSFEGLTKIYFGTEFQNIRDNVFAADSIAPKQITDNFASTFVEADIFYSAKLVSKAGLRYEYSSLLKQGAISPRLSVAYKLNDKSQFAIAYGSFYQKPETNYMFRNTGLKFSRATHYIMNFQKIANGQTLRVEGFYKDYKDLVTTNAVATNAITNNGFGYAKGVELFWRDKTNIKDFDYWVAYSFLDTKRKHLDYSSLATPSFAAKHTVNVVAKRFVNSLSTYFSATYSFASGRPYYNPNNSSKDFMTDRTMNYNSLGLQANYLKTFGKMNAVFILNVSNALGSKQVFGYRYAGKMNAQGQYASEAVTPMAKRFVFVGMYLSIGSDSRKHIID